MAELVAETTVEAAAPDPQRRHRWRRLLRRPGFVVPAVVVVVLAVIALLPGPVAGLFGNGDPTVCDLSSSAAGPRAGHPFGFDLQGCDLYANVVYGTRASLAVGLIATALALLVALVVGLLAGLYGRWVDFALSRLTDVFLGFPFLLGAVVVLNSVGNRSVWTVSVVLALFGWPVMARVFRSSVRSVAGAEYVLAARTMGLSGVRVVTRYVLPSALAPVLVIATITVGGVIVAESSLTFLGIGLQPPAISWGLQLADASSQFRTAPHLLYFPSLFLAVTVLSIIALGDTLRAVLDPRRGA